MTIRELTDNTQIKVAHNGHQALEQIETCLQKNQNCPQIIFLDVNMPIMDGFEFLDQLKQYNKGNLPIVILTSALHQRKSDRAKDYHVIDIVEKPLTEEKIQSILAKLSA